ncbi:MAG: ATP-binding cassette domain-containing protein [Sphingobacteriaceae bacterium]|nr:ATP-binding cassette domain-containing protein [Sphingobacteriaceae bacterium]
MSIRVEKLLKIYGEQKAVNEISFNAQSGRILGFLGPNGAGKSTTMKILTGYLKATSGIVEVCGLPSTSLEVKKYIGYLPENTPLYVDMYVKEFLTFVANTYQLENVNQKVKEVIEQVGLGLEQHKKIIDLSKGYKQRVGLAQAIIHQPKVLILDEPTSGLDPNQLSDIRTLIKNLGKDKTVILSTHIMQEVETLCDDILIINKGNLVANDSITGLKSNYPNMDLESIFRQLTQN